jgi:hypothetical protein
MRPGFHGDWPAHMPPASGSSQGWLAAGTTLLGGSAGLLGGNAWWLAVGSRPAWYSIPGLVLGAWVSPPPAGAGRDRTGASVAAAVGLLALMLDFLFLLPLGLVAPPWAVIALLAAWAALLALAVRQRRRPLVVLTAPAATAALAAGLLYVGGTFLGWTP